MPVAGVSWGQEAVGVFVRGHDGVQPLVVQTGTVRSVLVPPAEPEAGRLGWLDVHLMRRQLLETDLNLLGPSCTDTSAAAQLASFCWID